MDGKTNWRDSREILLDDHETTVRIHDTENERHTKQQILHLRLERELWVCSQVLLHVEKKRIQDGAYSVPTVQIHLIPVAQPISEQPER